MVWGAPWLPDLQASRAPCGEDADEGRGRGAAEVGKEHAGVQERATIEEDARVREEAALARATPREQLKRGAPMNDSLLP